MIINSIRHPWIQHASMLARERTYRKNIGRLIIGGHHIVKEYLERDSILPIALAMTEKYLLNRGNFSDKIMSRINTVHMVSEKCMEYVTREAAPEGIIAEIAIPKINNSNETLSARRTLIILAPRIPGNLGTLIRSAAAFGWRRLVLVGDSVDHFSYEAIRSSKGASLWVKVENILYDELADYVSVNNLTVLVADSSTVLQKHKDGLQFSKEMPNNMNLALIIGNESHGIRDLPLSIINSSIKVSIQIDQVESLNAAVAGSIIMHSLRPPLNQ